MLVLKRFVPVLILSGGIACDQLSKWLARAYLPGSGVHSYFGDLLRLQFAENPGAFLSLGESLTPDLRYYAFVIGVGVLVLAVLVWALAVPRLSLLQRAAGAAVGAGGISNLIDRVRFDGAVTDFLNIGIGPLRTGIFNIADMVLMFGLIVLLVKFKSTRN